MHSPMAKSLLPVLLVCGCSPATENGQQEGEEQGYFERRNVAPDPADEIQGPRKAEHAFARVALSCIHRQYPNKISHVMNSAEDVAEPNRLTPVFYGCFDWHSAVHGHWLLVRLWGQDLVSEMDDEIVAALSTNFTPARIAGEIGYFNVEGRASFERPYGLAWFLQLTAELREIAEGSDPKAEQARIWLGDLRPLEKVVAQQIKDWVPKLAYPIRLGTHNQSAFAFGLILDWARGAEDDEMERLIREASVRFHRNDQNCPISYEPSGEDFLSPCLMVADLMRRIMDQDEFSEWLTSYLPDLPTNGDSDWLKPGIVTDPSDGKLVHLDGVNLSRAWALEGIASALPAGDARRESLLAAAKVHGTAGEASVSTPHYAGSHWLASFATYLRTQRGLDRPITPSGAIEDSATIPEG